MEDEKARAKRKPTKKPSTKRVKLTELDRLQAATGVKRQRPNYLAKGERRSD